jgi:hypothetical protein
MMRALIINAGIIIAQKVVGGGDNNPDAAETNISRTKVLLTFYTVVVLYLKPDLGRSF